MNNTYSRISDLIDLRLKVDESVPPQTFRPDRIAMPLMKMGKLEQPLCQNYGYLLNMSRQNLHHLYKCESLIHHIKSPGGEYK